MNLEDKTLLGSLAVNSMNQSYRTLRGVGYEPEARVGCNPCSKKVSSRPIMSKKKSYFILLFLVSGIFIWFSIQPSPAAEGQTDENLFSIRAVNEPLREVLKKISKASGYEIRFNTQLSHEKVSIQLDNVTLYEALARVLQAYNRMSLWDDANNIITLLIFKKNTPWVTISGINRIFELATDTTGRPVSRDR
jgi:hypothetical protein